jgi:predicted dehydrogenase
MARKIINSMLTRKRIKVAVVGGGRGFVYGTQLTLLPEQAELVALCDQNPATFERWKQKWPGIKTTTEFQEICDDPEIDAVVLATPLLLHTEQAVQLMQSGKHVLSEVSASHTLDGCWELVETVESTGRVYMMAENFCYNRMNMLVRNMAERDAFGELTHAECGYIHDVRSGTVAPDGSLRWRGELLRDFNGINYPTHSLGPVSQWLGINRTDSFDYMITIASKPASQVAYCRELFGAEHPGAQPDFWKQGDSALSLIRTKSGVVIYLRNDFSSPRPWNYLHYGLQGTKGAFLSGRDVKEEPLVWLRSFAPGTIDSDAAAWESLWKYAADYEHPWWKENKAIAETADKRFGDYFVMKEFLSAIQEERQPEFDIYDAVAISSVFPLSAQSIEQNGQPVQFPDFARNKLSEQDNTA